MLNVALLSKWHVHAGGYGNEFMKNPNVCVKVVWDNDVERGKQWAQELGVEFEADLDKVLARDDIDAVSINTATTIHEPVMIACANAKKAIFTEKMLAVTTEEALRIADAVKQNQVPFLISFAKKCEARIRYAKKLLDEGFVGRLTHIRIRNAHNGASANWLPDTFYDASQCGGGAMMDLGAHPMYLALYFAPELNGVTSVFTDKEGKGVDDNCVSVMSDDNGCIVVSETAFVSSGSPFSIEINGTKGCIIVSDIFDGGVMLIDSDGRRIITAEEIGPSLPSTVNLFVDSVINNKPIEFDIDQAVAATKLMEAAYISDKEKRFVKF